VTAPASIVRSLRDGTPRPSAAGVPQGGEALRLVCFALVVAHVAYLAVVGLSGDWIVDATGHPVHTDFVMVYAAGKLALAGDPAAAWDWTAHRAAEDLVLGRAVPAYYGWHYPPPFLMVAAVLATLPYGAAFVSWMAVTLPLYVAAVRAIVGDRIGWLMAGAVPVLLPNLIPGQNGFLTAALIGGTLLWLGRHPVAAGVCLGLLTYKPQYGVLFPLILLVDRRWTVIAAATVTALALGVATLLVFGVGAWAAFLHWLPLTAHALLSSSDAAFEKFQSVFALVRLLGGGAQVAWAVQLVVAGTTAVLLCLVWRNEKISHDMKAAATAAGVLLATPYVYLYDLTVLAVALAFLLRRALADGFLPGERPALALFVALFVVVPVLGLPVGLPGIVITLALVGRRMRAECRAERPA